MILLDTNVLSELMRAAPDERVTAFISASRGQLAITTVTVHEITYGLALLPRGRRRAGLSAAFAEFVEGLRADRVLTLSAAAARRSGLVRAHRRAEGRPMDISDAHIAGIALTSGCSLATRNTADFDHVGLDLIDPWRA